MPSPAMPVKLVSSTDQAYGGLCKWTDFVDVTPWVEGVNFQPVPMLVSEYLGGGAAQNPAAWYRLNRGITVTGAGVSRWADASGRTAVDLVQATDTLRPALQSDGTILFDGVDNYLKTAAFTLNQPTTVYLRAKQVTWLNPETIFDGFANNGMRLFQNPGTPTVQQFAGDTQGNDNNAWTLDTYKSIACVYNSNSSVIQVGSTTVASATAIGTNNAGGFTLGALSDGTIASNIRVKEVMLFAQAHNAAQRALILAYLDTL